MAASPYRALPSVDRLLAVSPVQELARGHGHGPVAELVRETLEAARAAIAGGAPPPSTEALLAQVLERASARLRPSLQPVVNATGVILHTNLGRAPLSAAAISAMERVARGYSNLEFDLEAGQRGSRFVHLERLLCQLTGAEAALAVNNNAAAVLLGLSALTAGREVIVSRGQAVEIGGGFRIPDVMRRSGARLVEVGTTNRTYLQDYEAAITTDTAALLRVHASNFRVVGFTASVPLEELAELAHRRGLLLLDDLGSGCLLDTTQFGLAPEPTVQASITGGADLAFFSGDKLLGGPQAGVVVGRRSLAEQLQRHPLARALRLDKATIAGLAATLEHYRRGEATTAIPVWRMMATPAGQLRRRARRWARALGPAGTLREGRSMVGGGSLPEESLPTWALAIPQAEGVDVMALAARLRALDRPIVARVERETLLLDPRTVDPADDRYVEGALRKALGDRTALAS